VPNSRPANFFGAIMAAHSDELLNLQRLACALGGDISNGQVLAPGPGHSAADRSLAVRPSKDAPEGFLSTQLR